MERLEVLLDLIDDGSVLQDGPVVVEVDRGGLVLELLEAAAGFVVALLEIAKRGGG